MRTTLAVLFGKLISYLSKRFNLGGGSAAPGLYALKIDPNLVENLIKKIPMNVVITGTNGKTTTARMLAHFAKSEGLKVIRNHTGSNLERGIASTLVQVAPQRRCDLGIWELDEAAFNTVAPKISPAIVVFLNVFRDQLDRYGEIDTVVKGWSDTLKSLNPQTIVLVNGDDANTAKLRQDFKGKVLQFGVKDYKIVGEGIVHQREKENLDLEAKNIKLNGLRGSRFELIINHLSLIMNLPLPGVYHIYDFLAAFYAGYKLGFSTKSMISSLKKFLPAFGRMEKIYLNPRSHRSSTSEVGYIFLIKNPAGATQVFQTIAPQLKPQDRLLLALNDNLADGTDVSWIWDAEFEQLLNRKSWGGKLNPPPGCLVSGTRAYDLAVRLKYAGFEPKNITIIPDLQNAFKKSLRGLKGRLFILPTYTAMLELQSILAKSGIKKNYWEES